MNAKEIFTQAFQDIGIEVGKDIIVRDERFFGRVLTDHSIGLGESYTAGWWDAPNIVSLFRKLIPGIPTIQNILRPNLHLAFYCMLSGVVNRQRRRRALRDVQSHYDIGNALYEAMLDENMVYTCAYYKNPDWTLEQAQEAKIDLVYRKLHIPDKIASGQRLKVLDIGCGWGYALEYGARKYGVEGVGVTLSKEQVKWAKNKTKGLPVDIRMQDYRDLPEGDKFDAIFSLGMFEHVGDKNYREYMDVVNRLLKSKGLFLLHTIGSNQSGAVDPWINKYIFPGAHIPTQAEIDQAVDGRLIEHDFHNFGLYYAQTAEEWAVRFEEKWEELKLRRPEVYNERFFRMWKYYLSIGASSFYSGRNQLWQFVYSKGPLDHVYESVR